MNKTSFNNQIDPLTDVIRSINFYYPIILSVLATLGNSISFVIFSSSSFRKNPSGLVLKLKSLIDIGNVYIGTLRFTYLAKTNTDLLNISQFLCFTLITLVYSIDAFSSWLNVIISLDRMFMVFRPTMYHSLSRDFLRRLQKLATVISLILILAVNLGKLTLIDYIPVWNGRNETIYKCTALNQSVIDWINFVIILMIPFAIMSLSSSMMIYYLATKPTKSNTKSKGAVFIRTVLILDLCFLVFNLPRFVLQLKRSSGNIYSLLLQISAILKYGQNALTFLLWFVTNNLFRSRLSGMLNDASVHLSRRRRVGVRRRNDLVNRNDTKQKPASK